VADRESDQEQENVIKDPACPEKWDVRTMQNVTGLIAPTLILKRLTEQVMVMINAIETTRNEAVNNKYN
jgi:hypothetical protein